MSPSAASDASAPLPTDAELVALTRNTPPSGKPRSLVALTAVATLGSLLFGYDTGVIAGALPYMYLPGAAGGLGLTASDEGLVGALLCLGAALGALLGGRLSDRYGRRHNITVLAVIFLVGALACTFAPNLAALGAARFVLGMAVGGASSTVPVYLAENAPSAVRGPMVAMDQAVLVFGQLLAFSANAVIARVTGGPEVTTADGQTILWDQARTMGDLAVTSGNGNTWRLMLVLATLPAIALWIGIRTMPESSRWYAANTMIVEAIGSLKRVRPAATDEQIAAEVSSMVALNRAGDADKSSLRRAWATPWTRRLIVIGAVLGIFDQTTGINTAMYYLPKLLTAAGISTVDAITLNVVTGLFGAIGAAVGLWLISKFTRRHVGMYQAAGIVASLMTIAGLFAFGINRYVLADGSISAAIPAILPMAVVVVITIFVFVKQSGTVHWVLYGEIFPAHVRGAALGVATAVLWVANAIVAYVYPVMMTQWGAVATYLTFAAFNVAAFVFYWKVVPETKGRTLEEFEVEFSTRYGGGAA